jgi:hypothetical protein
VPAAQGALAWGLPGGTAVQAPKRCSPCASRSNAPTCRRGARTSICTP